MKSRVPTAVAEVDGPTKDLHGGTNITRRLPITGLKVTFALFSSCFGNFAAAAVWGTEFHSASQPFSLAAETGAYHTPTDDGTSSLELLAVCFASRDDTAAPPCVLFP